MRNSIGEAMKPFRLMHLLRHITQKTPCPNCKEPIFPEQIRVDTSTDNSALLTIHCEFCEHDLHVHVFVNQSDIDEGEEKDPEFSDISIEEVKEASNFLADFSGDASALFHQAK